MSQYVKEHFFKIDVLRSFELCVGIEPTWPEYKSGTSPFMLTEQLKTKKPESFGLGFLFSFDKSWKLHQNFPSIF